MFRTPGTLRQVRAGGCSLRAPSARASRRPSGISRVVHAERCALYNSSVTVITVPDPERNKTTYRRAVTWLF